MVHADETGWRQDGVNGCVWTFSAPTERYFLRRGRDQAVVDEVLGEELAGALVSAAMPPAITAMVPGSAAGPTGCGTPMTCASSTPGTGRWPGGLRQ